MSSQTAVITAIWQWRISRLSDNGHVRTDVPTYCSLYIPVFIDMHRVNSRNSGPEILKTTVHKRYLVFEFELSSSFSDILIKWHVRPTQQCLNCQKRAGVNGEAEARRG